jgi:hypothetical protein
MYQAGIELSGLSHFMVELGDLPMNHRAAGERPHKKANDYKCEEKPSRGHMTNLPLPSSIRRFWADGARYSLPIQDEHERLGMLEIEYQRARSREVEPGSDWTVRQSTGKLTRGAN